MHSFTIRRATRFVEASRGTTASDSSVRMRATSFRVSRGVIGCFVHCLAVGSDGLRSLILRHLLQTCAKLFPSRAGLGHDCRRRILHELLVRQARVDAFQLLAAPLDLALRALQLLGGDGAL